MKTVELGGQGGIIAEFPDDTSEEEILRVAEEYRASRPPDLPRATPPSAPKPGLLDQILKFGKENALPIVGGLAGGIAGTPMGAGVGAAAKGIPYAGAVLSKVLPFLVRAGMSGAGSAAGEAGQAVVEGKPEEAGSRAVSGLQSGAAGEALFGGAGAVARGVRSVIPKRGVLQPAITSAGQKTMNLLGVGGVRPAQVAEGTGWAKAIDLMDIWTASSYTGGARMEKHALKQATNLRKRASDDLVDFFGKVGGEEETGALLKSVISGEKTAWLKAGGKMFRESVDELAPTVSVPVDSLAKMLADELPRVKGMESTAGTLRMKLLNEMKGLVDEAVENGSNTIPFSRAHDFRSNWRALQHASIADDTQILQGQRIARTGSDLLEAAMDKAATTLNPQAAEGYRAAKQFYKEGADVFYTDLVRKMTKGLKFKSEDLVDVLGRTSQAELRGLRNRLGMNAWETFQGGFADDLIYKSIDKPSSSIMDLGQAQLVGTKLKDQLFKWGPEKLTEILGKDQAKRLDDIADALVTTQAKGARQGSIFIQLAQAGAVGGLLGYLSGSGKVGLGTATLILGGPNVASRIFTNSKASEYLLTGLRSPTGSKAATEAFGRLSSLMSVYALQERNRDAEAGQEGFTSGL